MTLAFAQAPDSFTYTYTGLPLPVYPDDWNTIAVARIFVGRSIKITKVTASVQVQFSGVGDLNVFMWSPEGTRTKLLERNCGSLNNIDTTFDDSAPTKFSDACPTQAGTGSFRGNEPLGNWNNQNGYGYWRLGIENNGSGQTGTVTGYSITITGTALGPPSIGSSTIVSTSSFLPGLAAPGDQLSILGVNLGPRGGLRADAGKSLPTTLGGTTVTFDGVAAPIYYAADRFVSVQVPTTLSTGGTVNVQVMNTNGSSTNVPIIGANVNPGIFTYEVGGTGQARAFNQDGSLNGDGSVSGSDRPAAPGSIVSIYATGLGVVTPAVPAGAIAPSSPLSTTALPVTANIAGRAATVTYAGLAPGTIGTYQVNIVVPPGAPSGTARLLIYADGIGSQTGVTIQVR